MKQLAKNQQSVKTEKTEKTKKIEVVVFKSVKKQTRKSWNLPRLKEEGEIIHRFFDGTPMFDYSNVKPEDITKNTDKFLVVCNKCKYDWKVSVNHHIHHKSKCPSCQGKIPWEGDVDRFKKQASAIHCHDDGTPLYDYSLVKAEDIIDAHSYVRVICKQCVNFGWSVTIAHHIYDGSKCPKCQGKIPWFHDIDRFIKDAVAKHHDAAGDALYIYDNITAEDIEDANSKVLIGCKKCNEDWEVSVSNHINHGCGCPHCSGFVSKLEIAIQIVLYWKLSIIKSFVDNEAYILQLLQRDNNRTRQLPWRYPIDITLDDIMSSYSKLYIQIDGGIWHTDKQERDERCCEILKDNENCFIIRSRPNNLDIVTTADANPVLVSSFYNKKNDITQSVQNIYDAIKHDLKPNYRETNCDRKINRKEWKQVINIVLTFVS